MATVEERTLKLEQVWREMDAAVDLADQPIELTIKKLVVFLNALGLQTFHSCEGHAPADGLPAPWINFHPKRESLDFPERKAFLRKLRRLLKNFYHQRQVPADLRLVLRKELSGFRLQNYGYTSAHKKFWRLWWQGRKSMPEFLTNEFQVEMNAFADFLEQIYWGGYKK